jgi:CheY-like chemotaxis protein
MKKKTNCVLLVDDNEPDNIIHKRVIEQSGITDFIGVATNGQEAIGFLKSKWKMGQKDSLFPRPSLIFVDIKMPFMDGWKFIEEYQTLDEVQKGKAVFFMLTDSLDTDDITRTEQTIGSGCILYKPLTLEMINEIMQKHFPD